MNATTELTPVSRFYGTPTAENAVLLAIADYKALIEDPQPRSDYLTALEVALTRVRAYHKLVAAIRSIVETDDEFGGDEASVEIAEAKALLVKLGEAT